MTSLRIVILGDRDADNPNHLATDAALEHSAGELDVRLDSHWWPTDSLARDGMLAELGRAQGLWSTTGEYRAPAEALRGIRAAREHGIPFLGTCSGFQHAVLEFARNVAGIEHAAHGEYEPDAQDPVIAPLACSLAGQWFEIELDPDSRTARCYGTTRVREKYYCSYGIGADWEKRLLERGLPIVARADDGTPRVLEQLGHPFFVATLFVPQARSTPEQPHPLVTGFLRAAQARGDQSSSA